MSESKPYEKLSAQVQVRSKPSEKEAWQKKWPNLSAAVRSMLNERVQRARQLTRTPKHG